MSVFIRTSVTDKKYDYNNNEKSNGSETTSNSSTGNEVPDANNLVRLSLNKPKEWNWELSTSKSSPHIAFPVIQLYDSATGNLLVEADDDECVYQGNEKLEKQVIKGVPVPVRPRSNTIHESMRDRKSVVLPLARSKSGSSRKSLLETIEDQVVEQLSEKGIKCNVRSRSVSKARSVIREETIDEQPKREKTPEQTTQFLRVPSALNKSKSAAEIPSQRRKKQYSRSSSSVRFTTSFLQRVSECRDGSSSASDSELMDDARQKRYFYRSSKAGTLLLCDESFNDKTGTRNRRSRNLDATDEIEDIADANQTDSKMKNEKIDGENNEKKFAHKSVRKSSSKLKFASTKGTLDENCIMPEEIEKKLNLNCVTIGSGSMKKANNNDKSSSTMTTEKQLNKNNARDYLLIQKDSAKRKSVIHKSILSKSNNDLSSTGKVFAKDEDESVKNPTSPLKSHMRYSCGNFSMENDDDDHGKSDSNAYKRLNRRRRTKHRSTSVGNNVTNSSTTFNGATAAATGTRNSTSTDDDDDIDEFVEKTGTKAQQLRLQRPERGKRRSRQNNIDKNPEAAASASLNKANTDGKINGKSFI